MFFFEPVLFIANIVPEELRGGKAHLARRYDMPDGVFSISEGKNEGLTDLSIKSIVEDSDGNIWFSNRTNLVRYDKSQGTLASVHDDWFIDGRSYSLVASASNDEGVVFFGGNAGITRVDTGIPFPEPHERHLGLE